MGLAPADGWWQQHGFARASIDFCEPNYASSHYVAEPINTLSALPYLFLGWHGWRTVTDGERWERVAFRLAFFMIALIGIGTMALHGTLTAPGQALDEIPMLILSQTLLFIILECESGAALSRPWLPKAMAGSCVFSIAVYLRFQAFYGAFLAVYISTVVLIVAGSWRLAFRPSGDPLAEKARATLVKPLVLAGIAAYVCGGSVAWLLEMAFCDEVSRVLGPAFLHPLWHMGALVGTWCCIFMLRAARLAARGARPKLEWHFRCVPVVVEAKGRD